MPFVGNKAVVTAAAVATVVVAANAAAAAINIAVVTAAAVTASIFKNLFYSHCYFRDTTILPPVISLPARMGSPRLARRQR